MYDDPGSSAAVAAMISGFLVFFLVFFVAFLAIVIVPLWRILKRLGFHPAWSFFILVPLGSLIGLYLLAFSEWPLEKNKLPRS